MSLISRVFIAVVILLSHLVIFFPMAELFLAYIILFNPPWFRDFLNGLSRPAAQ